MYKVYTHSYAVVRMLPPRISTPPRERAWLMQGLIFYQIHNATAEILKPFRRQRLSEEICVVLLRVDQWHYDLLCLYHVPDVEMSPLNMLGPVMMFWIIGQIPRCFAVCSQNGRRRRQ